MYWHQRSEKQSHVVGAYDALGWMIGRVVHRNEHGHELTMELEYQEDADYAEWCKKKGKDVWKQYKEHDY